MGSTAEIAEKKRILRFILRDLRGSAWVLWFWVSHRISYSFYCPRILQRSNISKFETQVRGTDYPSHHFCIPGFRQIAHELQALGRHRLSQFIRQPTHEGLAQCLAWYVTRFKHTETDQRLSLQFVRHPNRRRLAH